MCNISGPNWSGGGRWRVVCVCWVMIWVLVIFGAESNCLLFSFPIFLKIGSNWEQMVLTPSSFALFGFDFLSHLLNNIVLKTLRKWQHNGPKLSIAGLYLLSTHHHPSQKLISHSYISSFYVLAVITLFEVSKMILAPSAFQGSN